MWFQKKGLIVCLSCVAAAGTMAGQKYAGPPPEFFKASNEKPVLISPGDVLVLRSYYNPELNKTVRVREDGKISLDLFQGIQAAGQTPEELQKTVTGLYSKEFKNPQITVDVESEANRLAYVTGEVLIPGMKEVHGKMTVATLLAMSQVNQKTAGTKSVFLIRSSEAGKYNVYKLDASLPAGEARDIPVIPGDILFVPRKRIVKADDVIDQYVRQLLPGSPSLGASILYTPGSSLVTTAAAGH
jgi:protein involved in polysaccharide export with SLBB domain